MIPVITEANFEPSGALGLMFGNADPIRFTSRIDDDMRKATAEIVRLVQQLYETPNA